MQLVVSLPSEIHQICIPAFPFDLPTQSDTCEFEKQNRKILFQAHHLQNIRPSNIDAYPMLRWLRTVVTWFLWHQLCQP